MLTGSFTKSGVDKISKLALPGVILEYERGQYRKIDR